MRWIIWIVAGIAIVGALVVIIGYSLPKGHSATVTAQVALPPEAVYTLLTDVDKYQAWRPAVKALTKSSTVTWLAFSPSADSARAPSSSVSTYFVV